jgi:hypothetical protein
MAERVASAESAAMARMERLVLQAPIRRHQETQARPVGMEA